ncbi:hypothetical protein BO78DRAFT_198489 [Aspergillus sclerotiicarbonarius CBS 121057]|uniref:Uncharacterized protein n=1 Tax=Aspergillus sclerotiicarbonarius (strain CBS 121057 / IBT 28362) TaxID=1448318 RepID=A0A319EHR8_ASPSB|nr:hypothetical protein BO78DRAFT_198489 [Aspergillus sclerotiicarbonarius CBS 121057]
MGHIFQLSLFISCAPGKDSGCNPRFVTLNRMQRLLNKRCFRSVIHTPSIRYSKEIIIRYTKMLNNTIQPHC